MKIRIELLNSQKSVYCNIKPNVTSFVLLECTHFPSQMHMTVFVKGPNLRFTPFMKFKKLYIAYESEKKLSFSHLIHCIYTNKWNKL